MGQPVALVATSGWPSRFPTGCMGGNPGGTVRRQQRCQAPGPSCPKVAAYGAQLGGFPVPKQLLEVSLPRGFSPLDEGVLQAVIGLLRWRM